MPNATIEGPKIDNLEIKRVLMKAITDALEKAYSLPRQTYIALIKENFPENVSVGGQLISEKTNDCQEERN
ncbi:MAG: tautomerase family protein [Candidatus Omnitrophica bacterium]|nr:tautomerase family protein [Candidatus Omnitrophota bacterium]